MANKQLGCSNKWQLSKFFKSSGDKLSVRRNHELTEKANVVMTSCKEEKEGNETVKDSPHLNFHDEGRTNSTVSLKKSGVCNQAEVTVDPDIFAYIQTSHHTELQTLLDQCSATGLAMDSETSVMKISLSLIDGEDTKPRGERAQTMERFLRGFKKTQLDLVPELFKEVKEQWKCQISTKELSSPAVSFDDTENLVHIIGKTEFAENVEHELREVIVAAQNRFKQRVVVQLVDDGIPRAWLALLEKSGFCEKVQENRPYLRISVDHGKEKLCLEGPESVLQVVMAQVHQYTSQFVEKTLEFPRDVLDVLGRPSVSKHFENHLKLLNIEAVFLCDQTNAQVVGVNQESASRAEISLKNSVAEESVTLSDENIPLLESPKWKCFCDSLTSKFMVGIRLHDYTRSIIWIRGIQIDVETCINEITKFLDTNTIKRTLVPLEHDITRFLSQVSVFKLHEIKRDLSIFCVDTAVASNGQGIEIRGTAEGLQQCRSRIEKLAMDVQKERVIVGKPGMKDFLSQGEGSKLLRVIELENRCIISMVESASATTKSGERPREFTTSNGICITVKAGDLVLEQADVLVGTASSDLKLKKNPCAKALGKAAGPTLQQECNKKSPVAVGDIAIINQPGKLKCNSVIFAICSAWDGGNGVKVLNNLLSKCLEAAERMNATSIVFPAIGTGGLKFPREQVAEIYFDALMSFDQTNPLTILKTVKFVLYDQDLLTVQAFEAEFEKRVRKREHPLLKEPAACQFYLPSKEQTLSNFKAKLSYSRLFKMGARKHESFPVTDSQSTLFGAQAFSLENPTLVIFAGCKKDLQNAVTAVTDMMAKHFTQKEIPDKAIGGLTGERMKNIFSLESRNDVKVSVKRDENRIVICGQIRNVLNTLEEIHKILHELKETELGHTFPDFWVTQPKDSSGKEYRVHLFPVSRVDNFQEFMDVSRRFNETCSNHTIEKIERVQNPALYKTYAIRKKEMDESKGSNEMRLFHGTAHANCDSINHNGFNRSFCSKNANFGNGVYFALDASYSANPKYSPPDWNRFKYMYLARVLVGEFTQGRKGLITPPVKTYFDPTDTYDTVVDTTRKPRVFVAFFDWQCYPEYLITFTE